MKTKGEKAVVTKSTGSWYIVKTNAGEILPCRIKGLFRTKGIKSTNPVAVGDVVDVEHESEGKGVITHLHERKNYIIRKSVNLSKRTHIIASNIDQAVLIVTLASPKTLPGFIDRFLASAEAYNIPVIIVFNKIDLYGENEWAELEYFETVYRQAGYQTLHTSAENKFNTLELKELLRDKVSLLSGHSGVGKSTLINTLEPTLNLRTKQISDYHQQGMHTTTFAEMFFLSFGGAVIDTPGIRGFGLVDMNKAEIGDYFPEIFRLKKKCKFHNCLHINEPGCAVLQALENNELAPTRYETYFKIIHGDDEENPYRKDDYA